ncbi:hypothetical protein [Novipirellula rosea]|uniref:hypothetical protein n=1 Tax=Novipirellula rosea TaxID=1031540 RepID=UPI0031EA2E1B
MLYYERGRGILRRRVVEPDVVFDNPLHWPASEAVTTGSPIACDSGNANATVLGNTHYVSFYSGKSPDTAVMVSELPEPTVGDVHRYFSSSITSSPVVAQAF